MKNKVWVVVNWCEPTPESSAGCFGKFFGSFGDAWAFAREDAAAFKEIHGIDGELAIDFADGTVQLEWGDVMHHWKVEELKQAAAADGAPADSDAPAEWEVDLHYEAIVTETVEAATEDEAIQEAVKLNPAYIDDVKMSYIKATRVG